MLSKDQDQKVAEGGSGIQAGGNVTVVNVGVTASEARSIALDVAKATFNELTGAAKDTAIARVDEITTQIIEKLEREFPNGLQKARDPDFQYALFTVQKEFARSGDKDLGDLLVDLLVDRSKYDQRDILQIVLNESIATAPKLTDNQLAALAVIFLFKYTQNYNVGNHQLLGEYLDKHVLPFAQKLSKSQAGYQHLEFAGCGTSLVGDPLEKSFGQNYQGLFVKGFDESEITNREITVGLDARFFIPCINDSSKIQVKGLNKNNAEKYLAEQGLSDEDKIKILALFDISKMNNYEIKEMVIANRPYMQKVFDIWNESAMQHFNLTSVGMAIGHANIKRFNCEFTDLSLWIN
ncbi:hypothetical protein GCM10009007_08430 [Formosimonas limnophila]|uniref:Uncharacterized protein n=1 Tax=Formosimonas limnophila TaxID=1384487 RepID=A0A8J3G0H0_9BURK|nr:LPO_1073/Vpar_1526 family protein [Formosimonas limnophila]GHA70097.1 hypothetical protein GCM10009007_08430 [Formosimonas limnophila]